jgi:hypothetical protein
MDITEATAEDFISFVTRIAAETPDRPIDHWGGWNHCAVGDFALEACADWIDEVILDDEPYRFLNYDAHEDRDVEEESSLYHIVNDYTSSLITYGTFAVAVTAAYEEDKRHGW